MIKRCAGQDVFITSWMSVFHKMSSSQKTQLEYIKIDMDFVEIERHLEQRRKVKLSIIIMIFLISIGVIIYSVIHDVRRRNGEIKDENKNI